VACRLKTPLKKQTLKQQQPYTFTPEQQQQPQQQQPYTFTPEQQQQQPCMFTTEQHEIQWKTEEPYYMIQTNNPYTFYVPDKYDPDHFMPWVHPFTSVIAGPTGSGKSMFVRRFVHNIKHMMTPKPDRISWCDGEHQTLHGTVEGVEFQQGLPDMDNLDPRGKYLIIWTISWTKRTKGWLHSLRKRVTTETSASCASFRICFIEENIIEPDLTAI
jgi:hypothetical protein